jgi:hypothetical protein
VREKERVRERKRKSAREREKRERKRKKEREGYIHHIDTYVLQRQVRSPMLANSHTYTCANNN